ncbi:VHS1075 protein [Vibrio phage 1]|nr:VHS1075 protein [Vibrio phage 1]
MAVKIAKSLATKKANETKKQTKQPTPGTIVKGSIVEPTVVKQETKKPTVKIDTSAIAQPSKLKEGLKPFVEKLNDKKTIAAASKKTADADAKAVKAIEGEIVKFVNDENLAPEATIDVTVDGKILNVVSGREQNANRPARSLRDVRRNRRRFRQ